MIWINRHVAFKLVTIRDARQYANEEGCLPLHGAASAVEVFYGLAGPPLDALTLPLLMYCAAVNKLGGRRAANPKIALLVMVCPGHGPDEDEVPA